MSTVIIHDFVPYVPPAFIPTPTEEDNGKYVGVSEGVYDLSYVDALPEPKVPTKKNARSMANTIYSLDYKTFKSSLTNYQIQIKGSAGVYSVYSSNDKSAPVDDILNFFKLGSAYQEPMLGRITLVLFSGKPDGTSSTSEVTRMYLCDYTVFTNSLKLYFRYSSYYNETLYKGYFVIDVTTEGYTVNYISEN